MTSVLVALPQKRKAEFETSYWQLLIKYNVDAIGGWERRTKKDMIDEYREQREADFSKKLEAWKKAQAERKRQMDNAQKEAEMAGGNINDSNVGSAKEVKEEPAPQYKDLTDADIEKLIDG